MEVKLVQFYLPKEGMRVGVLDREKVMDITSAGVKSSIDVIEKTSGDPKGLEGFLKSIVGNSKRALPFSELNVKPDPSKPHLTMPLFPPEVWGCGVTYRRSAQMRDEDTLKKEGAKGIYDQAYFGERPEIFFKATSSRCVGPNDYISIRRDSRLTATEPELAYVLGAEGKIIGYTISNDVSAWDIERENPLYLPQSKTYVGCCAIGPVLATPSEIENPYNLNISCRIIREGKKIYEGSINSSMIKRTFDELTEFLCRDNPVPPGTVVSTGTGIIVPNDLPLRGGDAVEIEIDNIGVLSNPVKQL
jgi:2-dehydro-3-deoxy-D-arabinonate dehydratase